MSRWGTFEVTRDGAAPGSPGTREHQKHPVDRRGSWFNG